MMMDAERIRGMAEQLIRENPKERIIDFTLEGQKYWIKRKLGNGRNQLVKYSVEKEFYYEIARMTIAGRFHSELVPDVVLLTPDYMVTLDGGPTLKNILGSKRREEEKEAILEKTGAALAALHHDHIIHGRPALRDIYLSGRKAHVPGLGKPPLFTKSGDPEGHRFPSSSPGHLPGELSGGKVPGGSGAKGL